MNRLALWHRRVRRAVLARRRLIAALAAALAVAAGLQAAAGPASPVSLVVTAAHDLAGGTVVGAADLAYVGFTPDSVPAGALVSTADAVGRTTSTPVRAGEPLTDVRLLGASMLARYPGAVAAPVRIGDPGAVDLLRVGDLVDVIAADPRSARARVVADDVPVIALPQPSAEQPGLVSGGLVSGGLVVLAVPGTTAEDLAAAGVSSLLSVVINQ